ncbi:MAG: DUF1501 domain-containing protein [Pirellulaceae bacterium]|nr:DUF1501 domain-containing protein [Pirellulaceae bacterium]
MHSNSTRRPDSTRRQWLAQATCGLGSLALATLIEEESRAATGRATHHAPKAKRVIQLFMAGAASHIDLFDYKPQLAKSHGQPSDFGEPIEAFQNGLGPWLGPVWPFKPYGQSGKPLSSIVSQLGSVVDEMAFVHNMVGKSGVHSQATLLQTTGFDRPGFPSAGAWASYALGSTNDNLPTFVVLPDHRGLASNGTKNWDSAFLPPQSAGTVIYPDRQQPIADLYPNSRRLKVSTQSERDLREMLHQLNRRHALERPEDARLEARIESYELAAKMQLAAPAALDFTDEPEHILKLYGLDNIPVKFPSEINQREEAILFGRKCLAARRLIERGVRFVQIWSGNDNGFPRRNWDSHEDIQRDHGPLAFGMASGAAALIMDLKQRGLLEDTLVVWTTEFGRLPSSQGGRGRDHNPFVFTNWLCGGGVRGGITCGQSDLWGYKPADRNSVTTVYDIHATLLHQLGYDHTRLAVRNGGIDRRLTDVHGHVIHELVGT